MTQLPQQYDQPQISLCPEDTLHDVTSIAADNETSIFMLSPDYSKTALTHSIKETEKEIMASPNRQTSN
uniref:Uncharacterized protein n=1 Tax=Panagrolaimus sp. PS1159 TaxID=55785 RepID=A0AC35G1A5_9BILA